MLLATLCVAVFWFWTNSDLRFESVTSALRGVSSVSLIVALCFAVLQVFFQTARFAILVPKSLEVSWLQSFRVTAVGQVLNVAVPARGGDFYKAFALCPGREGARAGALGVIAADKAADVFGLTVVVLSLGLGSALQWFGVLQNNGALCVVMVALVVVVAAAIAVLVAKWRSALFVQRLVAVAAHFGAGLANLRSPPKAVSAVLLGSAAWLAEAAALIALTRGAGSGISPSQAVLALLALNVGIAVPVLPANLGAFEAGVALGLHHAGVPVSLALAVAFAHHGIQLAVVAAWGGTLSLVDSIARSRSESVFRVQQSDKVRALSHYEKSSAHYETDVKRGPLRFMRDRERASVLRLMGQLRSGETFLDVGCGGGFYSLQAKRAAMLVCAVDASRGMVDKLACYVDEALVRDVETLQLGGRTFDRVVCAGVLDFVERPDVAIVNLMRHVAPGGALVILAPRTGLRGCYYRLEKFAVGLRINLFTPEWFATSASKHDFQVTSLEMPLPHNLVIRIERKPTARE